MIRNSERYEELLFEARMPSLNDIRALKEESLIIDGELNPDLSILIEPSLPDFIYPPIKFDERLVYETTVFYDGIKIKLETGNGNAAYLAVPAANIYLVESGENERIQRRLIFTDETMVYEVDLTRKRDQAKYDEIMLMVSDINNRFDGELDEWDGSEDEEEENGDEGGDQNNTDLGLEAEDSYQRSFLDDIPCEYDLARTALLRVLEKDDWVGGRIVQKIKSGWKLTEAVWAVTGRNNLTVDF